MMRNKLFITLLFMSSLLYAQLDPLNIGGNPNDGTGDNLRVAAQKINANDMYLLSLINSNSSIPSWQQITNSGSTTTNYISTPFITEGSGGLNVNLIGNQSFIINANGVQLEVSSQNGIRLIGQTYNHLNNALTLEKGNELYLNSGFTEINDLTSSVTWANVPNTNITESSVTQHESALTITESQISDLAHTTDTNLTESDVDAFVSNNGFLTSFTETDPLYSAWDKDYNDLINTPNIQADTNDFLTSITESNGILDFNIPNQTNPTFDLGSYLSQEVVNLESTTSLSTSPNNTTARDSWFQNYSGSGRELAFWTESDKLWYLDWSSSDWLRLAKFNEIPTNNNQLTNGANFITGVNWSNIQGNQNDISLSGFDNDEGYINEEINDLTEEVTWANVPNTNITESSVTQHESALTITESQISDLAHTTDTNLTESDVDAFVSNNGFLTSFTETDPLYSAWDKDYNDLINTPAIPTNNNQLTNGAGYITNFTEVDGSITNEIELPVGGVSGQILSTDGSGNYSWVNDSSGGSSPWDNINGTTADETSIDIKYDDNVFIGTTTGTGKLSVFTDDTPEGIDVKNYYSDGANKSFQYGLDIDNQLNGGGTTSFLIGSTVRTKISGSTLTTVNTMRGLSPDVILDNTNATVSFLQGIHPNITFNGGSVTGASDLIFMDYDFTTLTGLNADFSFIRGGSGTDVENAKNQIETNGYKFRYIWNESTLESDFNGIVNYTGSETFEDLPNTAFVTKQMVEKEFDQMIQTTGRFYSYTDGRWVTNATGNFGTGTDNFNESAGTNVDPLHEWENKGIYMKKGMSIPYLELISRSTDATNTTEFELAFFFRYPNNQRWDDLGFDADGEATNIELYRGLWRNVAAGDPMGQTAFTHAVNDMHRRNYPLAFTAPEDGYLVTYIKPTRLAGSTGTDYFSADQITFLKF